MENQHGPRAEGGAALERSPEFRERSGTDMPQEEGHEAPALQRTPEIRETQSGNVEIRKDPNHVKKSALPEVLGKDAKVATNPEDILAFRRTVEDIDAPLE